MAVITERAAQFGKVNINCSALADALKEKFVDAILSSDIHERKAGLSNSVCGYDLWVKITKPTFRPFLENLFSYDFVNFHVMSGDDTGDNVALNYHLSIFQKDRGARIGITVTVDIPKQELSMPSIFDLLPGSEYSEREIREMFGIDFIGLPNKGLVFLPEDWNEEIKPWRRDAEGPSPELIRELN